MKYLLIVLVLFTACNQPKKSVSLVIDEVHVLTDSQKNALNNLLLNHEAKTSNEIVIRTVTAIDSGETPVTMGAKFGNKLGVGKKGKDNGCVITFCTCKQVGISTGDGIENKLDDITAKKIIEQVMIPEFRKGNNFKGLWDGCVAVTEVLERK